MPPVNTDSNFKVRNTLVVNAFVWANSTGIYFGAAPTLSINSTAYQGTSNNSLYLGGAAASVYVNTSAAFVLAGAITFNANIVANNISASGSLGSANQVLTSNGTHGTFWNTLANSAFTDTTNATNISSGTLAAARVGAPGSNTQFIYNNSGAVGGTSALTLLPGAANNITITTLANSAIGLNIVAGSSNCAANLFQVGNSSAIQFAINSTGVMVGNAAGLTSLPLPTDLLYTDVVAQVISGGARITYYTITSNSATLDSGNGPLQYYLYASNTVFTAPSNDGSFVLHVNNAATPGNTFSFTGFTFPASNYGDPYAVTAGNRYLFYINRTNGISTLVCKALQ